MTSTPSFDRECLKVVDTCHQSGHHRAFLQHEPASFLSRIISNAVTFVHMLGLAKKRGCAAEIGHFRPW